MVDMSWLDAQYAERKAAAEAQVTTWVPYTGDAYSVDPLYFMVHPVSVGGRLGSAEGAAYWYGLDDAGRVWAERQGPELESPRHEAYFVHGPSGPTEMVQYCRHRGGQDARHDVFTYHDGLLSTSVTRSPDGCSRSRFSHENGRLARVDKEQGKSLDELRLQERYRVSCDEQGQITEVATEGSRVVYRALPAGMSCADVEQAFLDRLVEAVPAAVAADPPPVPPSCLVLGYELSESSALPPRLVLPDSEGPEGIAALFDDCGGHYLGILQEQDPELYELGRLLDQARIGHGPLQTLLNEASRRLNELDWRQHLEVADGFLVFATDLELVHLAEHLRAVTTPEQATSILRLMPT